METIQVNIFTFDELSDEAKEKAVNYAIENWSNGNSQFKFEQLQYELSDIANVLEGAPDFPQYLVKLAKDKDLTNVKCTEIDAYRGICTITFHVNPPNDCEDHEENEKLDELRQKIKADLEYWALKNWRKQMEYMSTEEYWRKEFNANDRKFYESGKLHS